MALSTTTPNLPLRGALRASLLLLIGALVTSCQPPTETPESSLKQFLAVVRGRRAQAAWSLLSQESRAALEAQERALAEAKGTKPNLKPAHLLFEVAELVALDGGASFSVVSPPGDTQVVRVHTEAGETANVVMVREGSAWRVDLMGSIEPAVMPVPTSTAATP